MANMTDTLLLVEDNPDEVQLAQRAFRRARLANPIVVAQDGVAALELLFAPAARLPRLVLLDLKLPRLDGRGVLKAMRAEQRTRALPVVVLSSSRQDADVIDCYALGANSYLVKPVDFSHFASLAGQLAHYWLNLNCTARGLP